MEMSIITNLAENSWTVQNDWLTPDEALKLRAIAVDLRNQGQFHAAGLGLQKQTNAEIRRDEVFWVEAQNQKLSWIWQKLEATRQLLSEELWLGLSHFEAHLAYYAPGSFYAAHLDRSKAVGGVLKNPRLITLVCYLNPDWTDQDGGELVIYNPENTDQVLTQVLPSLGRAVIFRSDIILHEVRPTKNHRWSLTVWFHAP